MYSTLNRAQAVFGFFTTVALFVAGFAALSVLLFPTDKINTEVSLRDVKVYVAIVWILASYLGESLKLIKPRDRIKGRPHYYSTKKEEYAQMRFDLDAGTSYRHHSIKSMLR
jgi:hypothetical protein